MQNYGKQFNDEMSKTPAQKEGHAATAAAAESLLLLGRWASRRRRREGTNFTNTRSGKLWQKFQIL